MAIKVLKQFFKVWVRVPKESDHMKWYAGFTVSPGGVWVKDHWKHGWCVGGDIIVNRCFYGLTRADLGRHILATVKVVEKTTKSGRKFLALDIHKTDVTPGQIRSEARIRVKAESTAQGPGSFQISESQWLIFNRLEEAAESSAPAEETAGQAVSG